MELTPEQEALWPIARAGYEGYSAATGGRSAVTGDKLPEWDVLPAGVRNAWWSAAHAMMEKVKR
jgi:hypothetical protein